MSKHIVRVVLTGGPAAGKTTLISRIIREFEDLEGWRLITIPETATELISGFGIKPFGGCMSMLKFQDFVIGDQLHKEQLALDAAAVVPEDNVLILYDRALFDDKAYISDEEFKAVLASFGLTEEEALAKYDAVLHLISCAKGAEFAYDLGNAARTESIEYAREMDDRTLRAWSRHNDLTIIDNDVNFENKLSRALSEVFRCIGREAPMPEKRKYLIARPDMEQFAAKYNTVAVEMEQTYLVVTNPAIERRIRRQKSGGDYLYFYTEKHFHDDGSKWSTERPITQKEYDNYLLERDHTLSSVRKVKHRFVFDDCRCAIDLYPFSEDKAIFFRYSGESGSLPPEITVLREVTDDLSYKNIRLARMQSLG